MVKSKNVTKKGYERSLEETEMILDNIPGLVFYKDDNNSFIWVNKYMADAYKTKREALIGKSLFELYPKEVAQKYFDDDLAVIKSKKSKLNFIEPWDVEEGRRWVNTNKIPLYDDDGKCIGIIGFSTDVTEQVKTEQKLKQAQNQLNSIFSNLKDTVFVISEDYKILFKNENAHNIFGRDLIGRNCFEVIKGGEQICDNCSLQHLLTNDACQIHSEQKIPSPMTNEIKIFDVITTTIDNYNGKKAYIEVLRDITKRKEMEEVIVRLAAIVENSDDAIIGKTLDGTVLSWNKGAERIYSYTSKEIIGKPISILVPSDRPDEVSDILDRIKAGDRIDHFETVRVRKDGEEINISLTVSPIKDKDGSIIGASTIARNITERKVAEKTILDLSKFPSENPNAVLRVTKENVIYTNKESEKIFNIKKGSTIPAVLEENVAFAIEMNKPIMIEVDLNSRTYSIDITPISKGGYANVYGRDITERKELEEEMGKYRNHLEELVEERSIGLKESEEWLSTMLTSIGDAVIATDSKGNIRFLNPVAESLTGWKQSEAIKKPVQEIFNIINEKSREEVESPVDRVIREGVIVGLANHTVLISKDGREIPIDDSGAPIKDKEGKIIGVVLIFRDISERRRAEEALREREKYTFLLEALTDGVLIIDPEWRYLLINDEVARMVQMPKEKLIGNKMTDLFPGVEDTIFGKTYKQVFETGEPATAVDEFTFPEGRKIWYRVQVYPASEGLLIIVSDITGRKMAEEKEHHKTNVMNAINEIFQNALTCESVEELGKICLEVAQELSGAKFGFFGEVNKEGKFDTIAISNPGWDECKMPDSEATMIIKGMETRGMQFLPLKDGKSRIFNDPSNHPDSVGTPKGHPKITCLLAIPLKYKGNIIGQIGLGNKPKGFNHHDQEAIEALSIAMIEVLMHRRAEDKLRESEERFRMVFESKLVGTIFWNAEGEITNANEAFLDMIGYTKDEVLSGIVRWKDMTPPEYLERDEKLLKDLATNGYISPIEKEYYHKDGHRIPIILGAATLQGSTVSGVAFVLDITERKLAEKSLSIKNGISDVFLSVPDEDMYNEVLKLILEVMESKYGTFGYIDENSALVIPSMTRHVWDDCQVSDKAVVFPRDTWGDSIWPRAIKMKKTLFSNERSSLTPKGHVIISRNVSTPIIHKGKVIGLIQIANKEINYTEMDIRLMDMISKQLAPILNTRLQRDVEEKRRKIAERKLKTYSENLEETVKQRTKEIQDIQDELVLKERLAVLGQLAGGVGHELRNPLGAIKNATYYLNMVLEEPEPEVKETLEILEREVNSSEKIINSLLGFARPKTLIMRKVEINNVIRNVLSSSVIPKSIELIYNLGKSLPSVLADPDQLKQVFGNIILNATQAMSKGGQLTIKSELQNQDYLAIYINDSGEGISEENLEKIFKPLFTTKAKGIGLGLAICKTIVEKHGGSIEAKSELGKGSTFMIKLPIKRMETK